MTQPIGQIIREARKSRGMTQEELASLVHVSRQTVSHWENGRAVPGYDMLRILARELSLDPALLLGESAKAASLPDTPDVQTEPVAPPEPVEQAEPDTPPQSNAAPRLRFSRKTACILAAACLLLALFAASRMCTRPSYTLDDFVQEQTLADTQAAVRVYTHDSPIPRTGTGDGAKWEFPVFFKEEHGVGFSVTSLRFVWFPARGEPLVDELSPGAFMNHTGSTRIGPGEIRFINVGKPASSGFTHFGCILTGTDDTGSEVVFRMLVPLS